MSEITAKVSLCKDPGEKRRFQMDFSANLAAGETISTLTSVTSTQAGGGTSDLVITDSTLDGSGKVSFWIENGSKGRYKVRVEVVTSSTAVLVGYGPLRVSNS